MANKKGETKKKEKKNLYILTIRHGQETRVKTAEGNWLARVEQVPHDDAVVVGEEMELEDIPDLGLEHLGLEVEIPGLDDNRLGRGEAGGRPPEG